MLNIEKYREDLKKQGEGVLECNIQFLMGKKPYGCMRFDGCHACRKECIEWLCSEYKEPILTEEEKEYLSSVIKPFRERIDSFVKVTGDVEYINIYLKNSDYVLLASEKIGTTYKGMKAYKDYTLEELGL